MNAMLSAVGEDNEAGNYEDPAPMMMVVATEVNEEDEVFMLTPQLVSYIAGWKPEE